MTNETTSLAAPVEEAIADLEREYGPIAVQPSDDGGAVITVSGIDISSRWEPSQIDVHFLVPFNFPFAYIYPFYTDSVLTRTDGGGWPSALQRVVWRDQERTQISLRPKSWQPQIETASARVGLVRHWFQTEA